MYLKKLFSDLHFSYYPKFVQKSRKVAELLGYNLEDYQMQPKQLIEMGLSPTLKTEYDVPLDLAIAIVEHTVVTNAYRADTLKSLYSIGGLKTVVVQPRKEIRFVAELTAYLGALGISIETQKYIGTYRVDVYIPEYNIVVEFDERDHTHITNEVKDVARQRTIEKQINCKFIRVSEDTMIGEALAIIHKEIDIHRYIK